MSVAKKKSTLDVLPPIEHLARELVDTPDLWLDTPNDRLGGEKPRQLIGTEKEPVLRNLLEAIRFGSFS